MSLIILLSPAKKLNFDCPIPELNYQEPVFWEKTTLLAKTLKKLSVKKIGKLMHLSLDLSSLNHDRYQKFQIEQTKKISKPAMFVFNGEVYTGLDAQSFNKKDLAYADKHLRILSGLYGILKPLDFIQPYRLEMGTKLTVRKSKNLYQFWDEDICNEINSSLTESDVIINLASNEYFKAAKEKELATRIITPTFKDFKNGEYKTVMVYAKKSRGQMAKFIVQNQISDPEKLKLYDTGGYEFNEKLSSADNWVFTR
ncbi:MAG: cytoplasmic iron level regulating protein YaaA (DUF328/UPF0246 family) [Saprospiraceae bacterium]|jgi:cytoplasmic iron level regulating protein YaaA (DUF328/UPF0246 family)